MKAERIQTEIPELPGWQTQARLTAERRLEFPTFRDACDFVAQVAERTDDIDDAALRQPHIDIRQGHVTLRLVAESPDTLDAELALIDRLVPMAQAFGAPAKDADAASGAEG